MPSKRPRATTRKRTELKQNHVGVAKSSNHAESQDCGQKQQPFDASRTSVWMLGDVVWSKLSGHPWWPAVVIYSPDNLCYFKTLGSSHAKKYHVRFLGQAVLRGWVNGKQMFAFQGKDAYLMNPRVATTNKLPPKKYLEEWSIGVQLAEKALFLDKKSRLMAYALVSEEEPEDNINGFNYVNGNSKHKVVNGDTRHKAKTIKNSGVDQNGNIKTPVGQVGKRKRKQKIDEEFHVGKAVDTVFRSKKKRSSSQKHDIETNANGNAVDNHVKSDSNGGGHAQGKTTLDNGNPMDTVESAPEQSKTSRDGVCILCEEKGNVFQCQGGCLNYFHTSCLGMSLKAAKKTAFTCDACLMDNHSCFECKQLGNVKKCCHTRCSKYYHESCLHSQHKIDDKNNNAEPGKGHCRLHTCDYCHNTKDKYLGRTKMLNCIRCPTSYHAGTCIAAGCTLLSGTTMICEKHFVSDKTKAHHLPIHVNWCFACLDGGTLVCCDTCPVAFHASCTEDPDESTNGQWQCLGCREGKRPLYHDVVWVKYGCWRWWPAKICYPDEIPERILRMPHQIGEFPVMFYGSHDYCWLNRKRVFSYEAGDKGNKNAASATLKSHFANALAEAKADYESLKEKKRSQQETLLAKHPPPYKHIKCNRYVSATRSILDVSNLPVCECSPDSENPCGSGTNCLNRMMQFACYSKTCPAKDKCQNQFFQKSKYLECQPIKSASCGWGLKAKAACTEGDFVIEYQGELVNEKTCKDRIQSYHNDGISDYYFLVIDRDCIIDAYPRGNLSRFMNHSCDPNCDTQKWTVNGEIRVGLFANRDISPGDELTFNYNLDCLGYQKKQCKCGSNNCSGYLGARPKALAPTADKKTDKRKKKKKKRKIKNPARHEDDCFICGDGGELILCDLKSCSKCYHASCLSLKQKPKGGWHCPWHFCDTCGKRAQVLCQLCPNSYCKPHSEGEVTRLSSVVVCTDHADAEINEVYPDQVSHKEQACPTPVVAVNKEPRKSTRRRSGNARRNVFL